MEPNLISKSVINIKQHQHSPDLPPHPRDQPDNLLSGRRVHDLGQEQHGHRDEEGPENIFHQLVHPERLYHNINVSRQTALYLFRRENEPWQEQDRRSYGCKGISVRPTVKITSRIANAP